MDGRASTADSDGFGSSPSSNNGGTRLPGLAGTQSEKQLTHRELAALKTIKRNVDMTKYAGWLLGASGTWILLSRRKPPPRMIPKVGWCVVGGLGGSFLTMPAGILLSRNVLKDVEDPQHLRKVLAGAIEEQRQGKRPQVGVAPPKGLNGEADFDQQQQPQQNWGGEKTAESYGAGYDERNATADTFSAYSTAQGTVGTRSGGSGARNTSTEASANAAPDGTGPGTRWAQLRGDRGVEPSKWERIRQDNARTAYSRSATSSRAEQNNSEDPSASYSDQSQTASTPSQPDKPFNASRSQPRNRDEPVMTLSGTEDDPRWTSPASFSPQSSGWGNDEFVDDPAASKGRQNSSSRRSYGILSVVEDSASSEYQIESDAPVQVVKGSLLSALVGGVSGSIYGVLKGRQGAGTVLGTRMAFSTFAFAFPFFAVREYVMSPVLNRSSSGFDPANRNMRLRTVVKNRHTHNLLASGLAGAVVGAGAAAFSRGPAAIHKGIVTFGVACTGLQLAGNEARIVRDTMIRPAPRAVPVPDSMTAQSGPSDSKVAASQAAETAVEVQPKQGQVEQGEKSSWLNKVKKAMPIRSVSDQEYEDKLKQRLTSVNQRMADVEMEIREIEDLLKQQQEKEQQA
ncbi:hypothetical protein PHSY_005099 [Pseudozyma hubeiensis SY62]|uniref:Uncharacterized protein n=1 Tax=Pseudozyma hubeiensis (strain SY62) TaxID=1305764 RepID=R9P7Y3_PSEHS|nr:hypothetical protein PHSY_005099 [Pseudozyma hubeiensis SY62]GAC97513.1 hypothetical protein PHSY_005099 [Pseudozyma hubeiensis SY62]